MSGSGAAWFCGLAGTQTGPPDDGSSDGTTEIVALAGAEVLRRPKNQGKGAGPSRRAFHP